MVGAFIFLVHKFSEVSYTGEFYKIYPEIKVGTRVSARKRKSSGTKLQELEHEQILESYVNVFLEHKKDD